MPTKGWRKIFCINGHNKKIVGRQKNGSCTKCNKIRARKWRKKNKKLSRKRSNESYRRHRQKYIKISRKYQMIHRDQIRERERKWRRKNMRRLRRNKKRWNIKNRNRIRKQARKRSAFRRKTDLQYKMGVYLRTRLNRAIRIKQKKGSAVRDLGCSIEFFLIYIAKKFKKDMTWDNWGKVWELDHKKALFTFDLTDREQFLKAVNYKNMQPLFLSIHTKKTAKELRMYYRNREL